MENEHLRTAITRAGLTLEEFADIVQVDVKTVQRWLAGRTAPYPRIVPGWLMSSTRPRTRSGQHRPRPDRDRSGWAGNTRDWRRDRGLRARQRPRCTGYRGVPARRGRANRDRHHLPGSGPGLIDMVRASAANGCRIRLITEDPDERLKLLVGVDAIEVRASPAGEDHVLVRADDEMLHLLRRIGPAEASSPIIHLRRQTDNGLFDRLVEDFEDRWLKATPLASCEQLHAYLTDTERQPGQEPEHLPEADPRSARAPLRPTEAPTASPADAPRRWPGRRD